jgi:DNA-directed RNA polymerase specialized sigma24 family protein
MCFTEVRLNGRGYREVAADVGKSRSVVEKAVKGAAEKMKKFF